MALVLGSPVNALKIESCSGVIAAPKREVAAILSHSIFLVVSARLYRILGRKPAII